MKVIGDLPVFILTYDEIKLFLILFSTPDPHLVEEQEWKSSWVAFGNQPATDTRLLEVCHDLKQWLFSLHPV